MRKRVIASFDPKEFLAKLGEGKTISKYQKDQVVFSQGEVADAVFYIRDGECCKTRRKGDRSNNDNNRIWTNKF